MRQVLIYVSILIAVLSCGGIYYFMVYKKENKDLYAIVAIFLSWATIACILVAVGLYFEIDKGDDIGFEIYQYILMSFPVSFIIALIAVCDCDAYGRH